MYDLLATTEGHDKTQWALCCVSYTVVTQGISTAH